MKISHGSVVSLQFSLHLGDGQIIDQATAADPIAYLHGFGQIVPGLEQALEGLEQGTRKQISVPPDDGYGPHIAEAIRHVDRSAFPPSPEPTAGMRFMAQDDDGNDIPVSVVAVEGPLVTVDLNHPLAGKTLHYDVTIQAIREATAEELEHGHAHQGSANPHG